VKVLETNHSPNPTKAAEIFVNYVKISSNPQNKNKKTIKLLLTMVPNTARSKIGTIS